MSYMCLACGFEGLSEPPHSSETGGASYEICPCCGIEFGYDDNAEGYSYEDWRARWIAGGMTWFSKTRAQPTGWDPTKQLGNVVRAS